MVENQTLFKRLRRRNLSLRLKRWERSKVIPKTYDFSEVCDEIFLHCRNISKRLGKCHRERNSWRAPFNLYSFVKLGHLKIFGLFRITNNIQNSFKFNPNSRKSRWIDTFPSRNRSNATNDDVMSYLICSRTISNLFCDYYRSMRFPSFVKTLVKT